MISSNPQFLIFRQFTEKRIEDLLYKQWKVNEAEKALNDWDQGDYRAEGVTSFNEDKRNKLLAVFGHALLDYGKIT